MASLHIAGYVDMNYIFNISAGVGKGRPNKYLDVLVVQYLLFCATNKTTSPNVTMWTAIFPPKYKNSSITMDGRCGTETLDYILYYQNFRNSNYTLSEGNKAQVTFNVATDGAVDPWTYPAEPNLQHLGGTREGKPMPATKTLLALCYDAAKSRDFMNSSFEFMPRELQKVFLAH